MRAQSLIALLVLLHVAGGAFFLGGVALSRQHYRIEPTIITDRIIFRDAASGLCAELYPRILPVELRHVQPIEAPIMIMDRVVECPQ